MTLKERISSDIKAAMKAKDAAKLSTLRLLQSALTNKEIEAGKTLADEDVQAVVKSQIKQLKDASAAYEQAGRTEAVAAGQAEVAVLEAYLPAQMSDDELVAIVKDAVAASGAATKADAGRLMGAAMKAVAGRADGTRVKAIVESILIVLVLAFVVASPAHAATKASEFETFVVPTLRIARLFLVLLGIASVTTILVGGFKYMVAGGRTEDQDSAIQKMSIGLFGTMGIAVLFGIITIFLQRVGA